jgi:hypothetical protein
LILLLSHGVAYCALEMSTEEARTWWKINGGQFPSLNLLALDFATIPLSSAVAERVFRFASAFLFYSKKLQAGYGGSSVYASLQLPRAIKGPRFGCASEKVSEKKNKNFFLDNTSVIFLYTAQKHRLPCTVLIGYNTCVILYNARKIWVIITANIVIE